MESGTNGTAARLDCGAFKGNFSQYNFLAGPRVSASLGKVRRFAELLVGSPREHRNHDYVFPDFPTAVGDGLDYRFLGVLAWRFQVDYVPTHLFALPPHNMRFSTGIVLRF